MISPFSLSADCLHRLLPSRASSMVSPLSSARSAAIGSFLELCQGPCPIRSRALMAGWPGRGWGLRYAGQGMAPGPLPDRVARIEGGLAGRGLGAQIRVPSLAAAPARRGEPLAMRVGAG